VKLEDAAVKEEYKYEPELSTTNDEKFVNNPLYETGGIIVKLLV
jgi:hypothetical protein